jgi:hypothetical protein
MHDGGGANHFLAGKESKDLMSQADAEDRN